jgi:ABC-type phosphate transport system substrate-binding protein
MFSKRIGFVCLVVGLLGCSSRAGAAEEAQQFQVIVNPTNPVETLASNVVAQIFLKKKSAWENGTKVLPVDQTFSAMVRESFSRGVLGKSTSAVKAFWQEQIFAGRGVPPPQQASDNLIVAYVRDNPGAIGYVSVDTNVSKVKVIALTR